jgi:Flp pilus assembly protein TadG
MHVPMSPTGSFRKKLETSGWHRLAAFARDERGATVVELGLLALPFFAVVGAILQTAVVFLAAQVLDGAVQDSSRLIRTGQAQSATNYTADSFRAAICSRLFGLFDCTKLLVNVTVVSSFASATAPASPVDPTDPTKWTLAPTYNPGAGSDVIMVQVYYNWPIVLNFLGLSTNSNGTRLLATVRVFANEPFT